MRKLLGAAIVAVRLFDMSGLPVSDVREAMKVAARLFEVAGLQLIVTNCPSEGPSDAACASDLAPDERVVRVIRSSTAWQTNNVRLGDAVVDRETRSGVLATVYADRVAWMAADVGIDRPLLMGRAIAHEVGHLLLGSSYHSPHGLMRARWTSDELRRDRPSDWFFSTRDASRLRTAAVTQPR
jgi:hypothetical protein